LLKVRSTGSAAARAAVAAMLPPIRGLHLSTVRLGVSTF